MTHYEIKDNKLVCSFPVRMDTNICNKFEDELFKKIAESMLPVVFDLQDVEYIASMFLRIVQRVYQKIGAKNFYLINVNPNIKKVFKIAGFDMYLNINSGEIKN